MDLMGMEACAVGRGVRALLIGASFLAATVFLAAAPAAATPATINPVFGFNSAGLEGLPIGTMDGEDGFLAAGEVGFPGTLDIELVGTATNICIFSSSSSACQSSTAGLTGAWSAYVTFSVSAVDPALIDGPFTLFLSGLSPGGLYAPGEVTIELDPTLEPGLDVSSIPGFNLRPFGHVVDETFAPAVIYDYIGWQVQVGDTITFRYDVSTAPGSRGTPSLMANGISRVILPIPEPGTSLLMGIGLAGLALAQRRLAPADS
jgi:hypothetical protein